MNIPAPHDPTTPKGPGLEGPGQARLGRRHVLKLGLLGGLLLGGAGLAASLARPADGPAPGYARLRAADLDVLGALVPVILAGAVPAERMAAAVAGTLRGIDDSLDRLSPAMLGLTVQLLDVLASPVTRGPLTGLWGAWSEATPKEVGRFLDRWRDSRLALLQRGHASLLQLVLMSWYGRPESWAHCGYPGPPAL